MSAKSKRNKYLVKKFYKIFVIIHPTSKEFYVHFTYAKKLDRMYRSHRGLENKHTRAMFEKYRDTDTPPEMYLIAESELTLPEANKRQLIWMRYFLEKGYVPLNDPADVEDAKSLNADNKAVFEKLISLSVDEVINERNRLFADYKPKPRIERTPEEIRPLRKEIKFRCKEEAYILIHELAARSGKSLNAYIVECALYGGVLRIDFNNIREHTRQLSIITNELNALIKMLVSTNCIYQSDVEKIISMLQEISKSENKLLRKFNNYVMDVHKNIMKEIKETIDC